MAKADRFGCTARLAASFDSAGQFVGSPRGGCKVERKGLSQLTDPSFDTFLALQLDKANPEF